MAKPTSLYIDLEKRTEQMREYGIKGTDVYLSQASPWSPPVVTGAAGVFATVVAGIPAASCPPPIPCK